MKRIIYAFCALITLLPVQAQRIGPLIDAPWGQGEPFNRQCPLWDGEYPVEVGCVATSMTQIMAHYRYPECTRDTLFGWQTDHIVADTILPGAPIDWNNIRTDYRGSYTEAEADAIAALSLYASTAVHMNYGRKSSGANTSRWVTELPRVFGYKSCVECDRAMYTQDGWRRLLINEFENGRPVLYAAHNMDMGGHAFVLDGYDFETGRFHANWGYDGTFDRWVDIDVMGQFEHPDDLTFWGLREAMYCNHYALLIHPTEIIQPAADSIVWHDGDVTIESMTRVNGGDTYMTEGYELMDIHLTSHRPDTITYTFEVLSNAPSDTAVFQQADCVALGGVVLMPGESRTFRTSARFMQTGERILRLSNDDVTLMCPTPVHVREAKMMWLGFDTPRLLSVGSTQATLAVDVTNKDNAVTAATRSGALVTYCLFPEDSEEDWRHWQVLSPNDFFEDGNLDGTFINQITDTVTFRCLEPSTDYTLKVRWPWGVQSELAFTTLSDDDAIDTINDTPSRHEVYYDLAGRRLPRRPSRGFYIKR